MALTVEHEATDSKQGMTKGELQEFLEKLDKHGIDDNVVIFGRQNMGGRIRALSARSDKVKVSRPARASQ